MKTYILYDAMFNNFLLVTLDGNGKVYFESENGEFQALDPCSFLAAICLDHLNSKLFIIDEL